LGIGDTDPHLITTVADNLEYDSIRRSFAEPIASIFMANQITDQQEIWGKQSDIPDLLFRPKHKDITLRRNFLASTTQKSVIFAQ
jgi:hypothetical protein